MNLNIQSLAHIYFCTGARNHDLLNLFPKDRVSFEYDERMASFKALGATKRDLHPVAICTTSGTAVSQCVSAMLEAQYSELPLVLITGDRPKKLHGTGAPQTVDHEGLTHSVRGSYYEISFQELANFEISDPVFPVHINVLVDDTKAHDEKMVKLTDMHEALKLCASMKKPLILISHENKSMRAFVEKLKSLGVSFYSEVMSSAHDLSFYQNEKVLLQKYRRQEFDGVIRIGHTPLSKIWRLLETSPLKVVSFDSRGMTGLSFGHVMKASSRELSLHQEFWDLMQTYKNPSEDEHGAHLTSLMGKYPGSEVSTLKCLHDQLPKDSIVYLGNSLMVRFFELIQTKSFQIFGNRGVNGIDGQLATAIGIAHTTSETVYCLLGDITTYYDLSSLKDLPKNLKLVIMNNKGGRIFDMLKLDRRIVLEHQGDFKAIIEGFGLHYALNKIDQLKNLNVLELQPDAAQSAGFLKEWTA